MGQKKNADLPAASPEQYSSYPWYPYRYMPFVGEGCPTDRANAPNCFGQQEKALNSTDLADRNWFAVPIRNPVFISTLKRNVMPKRVKITLG